MVSPLQSLIISACVTIAFFLYSVAVDMSLTMYTIGVIIILVGGVFLMLTSINECGG